MLQNSQEHLSADDTKQTAKPKIDVYMQAAEYVADLLEISQLRGAFTLTEADGLVHTVKTRRDLKDVDGRPAQEDAQLKQSWALAFEKLNVSQVRGKLTLKEAWTLYNAIQIYEQTNGCDSEST